MIKRAANVTGIVFGSISAILGLIMMIVTLNLREIDFTSFGGDFYTYEYRATVVAAKSGQLTAMVLSLLLMMFGLFMIILFASKISEEDYKYLVLGNIKTVQKSVENLGTEVAKITGKDVTEENSSDQ